MLRNIFFHKKHSGREQPTITVSERERWSAKSDVSKVLFPDIGKITNQHKRGLIGD